MKTVGVEMGKNAWQAAEECEKWENLMDKWVDR